MAIGIYENGTTWQGYCTWGVNAHTASYYYLVTAGHCLRWYSGNSHSGWVGSDIEVYQRTNSSGQLLTAGNTYVHYTHSDDRDSGRIEAGSYPDDNCYHHTSSCSRRIKWRSWLGSVDVGDFICASLGTTNLVRCNYVTSADFSANDSTGHTHRDLVAVGFATNSGDSGAGGIYGNPSPDTTFIGLAIMTNFTNETYFQPAYRVKQGLGSNADFNCKPSGNKGSTCPGVNW